MNQGHSLFISMYLARESPFVGGFQEAVKDCLNLIVISGSYVDNSSAIAICATMRDSVVPGTYTPLKYVDLMTLADYASLQNETKIYVFSCLDLYQPLILQYYSHHMNMWVTL